MEYMYVYKKSFPKIPLEQSGSKVFHGGFVILVNVILYINLSCQDCAFSKWAWVFLRIDLMVLLKCNKIGLSTLLYFARQRKRIGWYRNWIEIPGILQNSDTWRWNISKFLLSVGKGKVLPAIPLIYYTKINKIINNC